MKRNLTIGTRRSQLALWQANYVAEALRRHDPELTVQLQHIVTQGDKILDVPLARIGGKGLFTTELEQRLLDGTIDLAVHSLKDLPADVPDGLCLAAITARHHVHDAFVSNTYASLEALPAGARIGTSSLRRKAQLLHTRPDLFVADLRGNVDTRLKKLDDGQYDAIILAEAGLQRLGRADRITQLLPVDTMIPAVGQGALAIETRADDESLKQALAFLNDEGTAAATTAERTFLAAINGSCQVPVGVYGTVQDGILTLQSIIAAPDGSQVCRTTTRGSAADSAAIGHEAACTLLDDAAAASSLIWASSRPIKEVLSMNGIVYLTGAGPGDYRLLTLRGREVLERADVVIYDYLADPRLLEFAPPTAEKYMSAKKRPTTPCPKIKSSTCSSPKPKKARLSSVSKAATPSSSAAAAKKAGRSTTRACPLKSSQASRRPSAPRPMPVSP